MKATVVYCCSIFMNRLKKNKNKTERNTFTLRGKQQNKRTNEVQQKIPQHT